jgi:hypothetical protein
MRTRLPEWARVVLVVVGVPLALAGVNGLIWATAAIDGNPSWPTQMILLVVGLGAVVLGIWPSSRHGARLPRPGRAVLVVGGLLVALSAGWMLMWTYGDYGDPPVEANPDGGYSVYGAATGYVVRGRTADQEPDPFDLPWTVWRTDGSGQPVEEVFRGSQEEIDWFMSSAREPVVTGTRDEVYDWVHGQHDWQTRTVYIVLTAGLVAIAAGAWPQRRRVTSEAPPAEAASSTEAR